MVALQLYICRIVLYFLVLYQLLLIQLLTFSDSPTVRAVPEIILGGGGGAGTFLSCGGGVFVDNVSEGWGSNLSWGSRHI